jgi:hypothetical protein
MESNTYSSSKSYSTIIVKRWIDYDEEDNQSLPDIPWATHINSQMSDTQSSEWITIASKKK